MQKQSFIAEQLTVLAAAFRETLHEATLRIYANDLADIPTECLLLAFEKARLELTYFPRIAEIRAMAGETEKIKVEAEAHKAWDILMDYVDKWVCSDPEGRYKPDPTVRAGVMPQLSQRLLDTVRRTGGWRAYKCMTNSDFPFQRERFLQEYQCWKTVESVPEDLLQLAGEAAKLFPAPPQSGLPEPSGLEQTSGLAAPTLKRGPLPTKNTTDQLKAQAAQMEQILAARRKRAHRPQ